MKPMFKDIKANYIKWWKYIILWFLPKHYSVDGDYWIMFKIWRGNIYYLKESK